jgi:RecJ-like exonuclease
MAAAIDSQCEPWQAEAGALEVERAQKLQLRMNHHTHATMRCVVEAVSIILR